MDHSMTRRSFGKLLAATAAVTLIPVSRSKAVAHGADHLARLPESLQLFKADYSNWDQTITIDDAWTVTPENEQQVLDLANWARDNSVALRPCGFGHSWSPVATSSTPHDNTLLVDVRKLNSILAQSATAVHAQCGVRMDDLLAALHTHGTTLLSVPAPGDVTVAGAIAVNGHGTGLPLPGEQPSDGRTWSTMSNLVTAVTVVTWNDDKKEYAKERIARDDSRCGPLLTCLGNVFILSVELQVAPDFSVHCINRTDISIDDLFSEPEAKNPQSLQSLIDEHGRVGLIWYCFTEHPWVQIWKTSPQRPLSARRVTQPYNYPFADTLPNGAANLLESIVSGRSSLAPEFGSFMLTATRAGIKATGASNMWGDNKNFVHFVRPTTLKVSAGSLGAVVRRADIQRAVHTFSGLYTGLLDRYRSQGKYPINGVVELRVNAIDNPADSIIPQAVAASLSSASADRGHPDRDTVIWLDVLTLPGTPHADDFYHDLENQVISEMESFATIRMEWSKRWAHGDRGPWSDPDLFSHYSESLTDLEGSIRVFETIDPYEVFSSPFLPTMTNWTT